MIPSACPLTSKENLAGKCDGTKLHIMLELYQPCSDNHVLSKVKHLEYQKVNNGAEISDTHPSDIPSQ